MSHTPPVDSNGAGINKVVRQFAKRKAQISEIEAEINGGALVELGRILGRPIYVRVDHHDPEKAKAQVDEIQAILLQLFNPTEELDDDL